MKKNVSPKKTYAFVQVKLFLLAVELLSPILYQTNGLFRGIGDHCSQENLTGRIFILCNTESNARYQTARRIL